MERKIYKFMTDGDVSEYIQGRISGVIAALCEEEQCYPIASVREEAVSFWHNPKITNRIFTMNATEEEYQKVKTVLDKYYPGLCTFYKKKG